MATYRHRPSLRDVLDRVTTDEDDAEIFEFLEEIDSLQAAPNERWQSPKAQHRQDYVLKMYLGFLRNWLLRREHQNSTDDVLMAAAFPSDVPKLIHQLQSFMTATFLKARPRSHQSNERIQYHSLAKYRECVLFWVRHVFTGRTEAPPDHHILFDRMTAQIRKLQKECGRSVIQSTPEIPLTQSSTEPFHPDYNNLPDTMSVGFPGSTRELLGWSSDQIPDHLVGLIEFGEPTPIVDVWDAEAEKQKEK